MEIFTRKITLIQKRKPVLIENHCMGLEYQHKRSEPHKCIELYCRNKVCLFIATVRRTQQVLGKNVAARIRDRRGYSL